MSIVDQQIDQQLTKIDQQSHMYPQTQRTPCTRDAYGSLYKEGPVDVVAKIKGIYVTFWHI